MRTSTGQARRTAVVGAAALVAASLAVVVTAGESSAAPKRPDLQLTRTAAPPAQVDQGGSFRVSLTVANRGRATAKPTSVRLYLSKDRAPGGDVVGATAKVKRLPAKRSTTVRSLVRVPRQAKGRYWLLACADPTKKVRESSERNNCRVSSRSFEVAADLHGQLSGNLTFLDEGSRSDGPGQSETWRHTATVDVKMNVDGDPAGDPTFTSTGSGYSRHGSWVVRSESANCVNTRTRTEKAVGELRWTGNRFSDEIRGSVTRTDLSGIRIGVTLQAPWTETTTQAGRGTFPCDPFTKTTTGAMTDMTSIELTEVSATADQIVYAIVRWEGDGGTTSDWDKVQGRLTLSLR